MDSRFEKLLSFIPRFKEDDFGTWIIDYEHKGTVDDPVQFPFVGYSECVHEFRHELYEIVEKYPEFRDYRNAIESHGIEWGQKSMEEADVSELDETAIMGLLMGAERAERFCDGALLGFFESGAILKWLLRLEELVCN